MRQRDTPAHLVSLAQTLANVEGELRQMRFLMGDLEMALFGWTATLDAPTKPPAELHNVDLLTQTAEALADFVACLSFELGGHGGSGGGGLHVDLAHALGAVPLGRLKMTLGRRAGAEPVVPTLFRPKPSSVDLF